MPKYKVSATMDVAYVAEIEAPTSQDAWDIAADLSGDGSVHWEKLDDIDWTLESIWEVKDD